MDWPSLAREPSSDQKGYRGLNGVTPCVIEQLHHALSGLQIDDMIVTMGITSTPPRES